MKQLLKIYILDDDPVILGGFTDALTAYLEKMPQYDVQITRFTGGSFCSICPTPNLWICC